MLIMHIGAAAEGLSCVFAALERAPHLGRHLIATHINRSPFAFSEAAKLVAKGGFMDISSGLNVQTLGPETLKPSEAIALAMRQGVAKERILMSSDGNGSAARYGDDGSVSGLVASDLGSLHTEFADCVKKGMPLSEALCPITRNVAQAFSLSRKGPYRGRRRCRHPVARARSGPAYRYRARRVHDAGRNAVQKGNL